MSLTRLLHVSRKEFIQLRRDRVTLALIIGIPIVQILLFGYAIDTDVRHLPTAIADASGTRESRDLVARFRNTTYFDPIATAPDESVARSMLLREEVGVAIVIPHDYARRVHREEPAEVQVLLDASDPMSVSAAMDAASAVALDQSLRLSGEAPRVTLARRAWYNPDLESSRYIVPGLLAVILTLTLVLMTVLSVTREQERGTMEMIITTPVGKVEFLFGKLLPYLGIAYFELTIVLAIARFVFAVPIHGSVAALYLFSSVFIVANLATGLLLSTLAKNQLQAMQMAFFFFLPTVLLSGFMFPLSAMPRPIQLVSRVIPATHYLRMVRAMLLKGLPAEAVVPRLWPQLAFLVVVLALAVARFRKRLA
ncbi:MAG: ABC transporter permease [Acidobacteria bacterium]|nr:ABC transporter permease [Acidobacteriota bacterium]